MPTYNFYIEPESGHGLALLDTQSVMLVLKFRTYFSVETGYSGSDSSRLAMLIMMIFKQIEHCFTSGDKSKLIFVKS